MSLSRVLYARVFTSSTPYGYICVTQTLPEARPGADLDLGCYRSSKKTRLVRW
jgi:hypothetical protein